MLVANVNPRTSFGNASKTNNYKSKMSARSAASSMSHVAEEGTHNVKGSASYAKRALFALSAALLAACTPMTGGKDDTPAETPTTPTTPTNPTTPTSKLSEVEKRTINTFETLNPIIETSGSSGASTSKISKSALGDTATGLKEISYELGGEKYDYKVKSIDTATNTAKTSFVHTIVSTGQVLEQSDADLVLTDTGVKLKYSPGGVEEFLPKSTTDLIRNTLSADGTYTTTRTLENGGSQGTVVAKNTSGVVKENWTNFKLFITNTASTASSRMRRAAKNLVKRTRK